MFEEIHGFASPGEYKRFLAYLKNQCEVNILKEIPPDPTYNKGEIYGGTWFKELETGYIWRLLEPDPPFYGLWERVVAESPMG